MQTHKSLTITFAVCLATGKHVFHTVQPFFRIDFVLEFHNVLGFTETFNRTVFPFALDFYAVIHHATQNAGTTVHTQVFDDSDLASFPVQRVSWTLLNAQLALQSPASSLVNADFPFLKEFFHACRSQKLLTLPLLRFLFLVNRQKTEYVNIGRASLRHPKSTLKWQL